MTYDPALDAELDKFEARALEAWNRLAADARKADELHFAMSLNPEFRWMREGPWSSAHEAQVARNEYIEFINSTPNNKSIKFRMMLSLYSYLSEASGFYEVPKNWLRIISGEQYSYIPFDHLVRKYTLAGAAVAPNANAIMKDIIGHAKILNFTEIVDLIQEAFDSDIRNGYAHADYVVWKDGIHLTRRNGGSARVVTYDELSRKLNKALLLFESLERSLIDAAKEYTTPKLIRGRMNYSQPETFARLAYDVNSRRLEIKIGDDVGRAA